MAAASFSAEAVRSARLPNGLTALVLADPLLPSLAYVTTYRVGSRNERPGITGISHLFEHMMFNGARRHGPKAFDKVVESNGGFSNAYTTHDVTSYYEVMPSDKLGVVLDLEADRMRDLELSERNLASEREVVMEERRLRTDESPIGALYEHLYASAYMAHPYRWPVIGWMADIEAISVQDINDYFKLHYRPGRAVVAVAGAVDPDEALAQVAEALGGLEPGAEPGAVVRSEPEQRGERRVTLRKEAQLATLLVGFHACDAASPDLFALDVLQTILSDGDSSRLRRKLVLEEESCVELHVDFPWSADPGLFTIAATMRPGVEPATVEEALHGELLRIAQTPPEASEVRKATNQLKADFFRRLKTNEGRADLLAGTEVLHGSYAELFELPARYAAVTATDVQAVAARWLRRDGATTALLDPLPQTAGSGAEEVAP